METIKVMKMTEAARILGIPKDTLKELCRRGKGPRFYLNEDGHRIFREDDVTRFRQAVVPQAVKQDCSKSRTACEGRGIEQVLSDIVSDSYLEPSEKVVMLAIIIHEWETGSRDFSLRNISSATGIPVTSVSRHIDMLGYKGYVNIVPNKGQANQILVIFDYLTGKVGGAGTRRKMAGC